MRLHIKVQHRVDNILYATEEKADDAFGKIKSQWFTQETKTLGHVRLGGYSALLGRLNDDFILLTTTENGVESLFISNRKSEVKDKLIAGVTAHTLGALK